MKLNTKTKGYITQGGRWAIVVMAALTVSLKIAEASAHETLKLIVANPELAQYTTLVNSGYLFFM